MAVGIHAGYTTCMRTPRGAARKLTLSVKADSAAFDAG